MKHEVFVLQIILKYDLEESNRAIGTIKTAIKRWCHPGMHSKRNIAFVVVTDEGYEALATRLWPTLHDMHESGGVERFFIMPDPGRVISDHAQFDPLMHWLALGRKEAGERNQSYRLRHLERRQRRV